jgi:hypothetical protein
MNIPRFEACYVFLSSGVAVGASGIGITPSGHIVKVPGNNPEDYRHIEVGMAMALEAENIADKTLRAELLVNATKLIAIGRTAIEAKLKNANIGKAEAA